MVHHWGKEDPGPQILLVQPELFYQSFLLIHIREPLVETIVVSSKHQCVEHFGSHCLKQMAPALHFATVVI